MGELEMQGFHKHCICTMRFRFYHLSLRIEVNIDTIMSFGIVTINIYLNIIAVVFGNIVVTNINSAVIPYGFFNGVFNSVLRRLETIVFTSYYRIPLPTSSCGTTIKKSLPHK